MRLAILFVSISLTSFLLFAQKPVPEATELYLELSSVTPGILAAPPSDAIVLFDGTGLTQWQTPQFSFSVDMKGFAKTIPQMVPNHTGNPAEWLVDAGEMIVNPGKGAIATRQAFGDIQLHMEWLAPTETSKKGQQYSNSGIFLMGLYEIQILNSYNNETYNNGQAGSLYKQYAPLVNASLPTGEWQTYDIIFMAPKFSEKGTMVAPARVTLLHNGVLVQNNAPLLGPTCYIGASHYIFHEPKLPLILQDHGDPVRFRNIWVREL